MADLRPPGHLPVRLCGLDPPVRGEVAARVLRCHRGTEECEQPPRRGEVHPAVVHHGVALVREVVGLAVVALGHVLVLALAVDGLLVDGDVAVAVGPVLGVDEPQHVQQLVRDQRLNIFSVSHKYFSATQ